MPLKNLGDTVLTATEKKSFAILQRLPRRYKKRCPGHALRLYYYGSLPAPSGTFGGRTSISGRQSPYLPYRPSLRTPSVDAQRKTCLHVQSFPADGGGTHAFRNEGRGKIRSTVGKVSTLLNSHQGDVRAVIVVSAHHSCPLLVAERRYEIFLTPSTLGFDIERFPQSRPTVGRRRRCSDFGRRHPPDRGHAHNRRYLRWERRARCWGRRAKQSQATRLFSIILKMLTCCARTP